MILDRLFHQFATFFNKIYYISRSFPTYWKELIPTQKDAIPSKKRIKNKENPTETTRFDKLVTMTKITTFYTI